MPLARITGPGLAAIACSVALLWGSFIVERMLVRQAAEERILVMREVQHTQRLRRSEPVSAPILVPRPIRPAAG